MSEFSSGTACRRSCRAICKKKTNFQISPQTYQIWNSWDSVLQLAFKWAPRKIVPYMLKFNNCLAASNISVCIAQLILGPAERRINSERENRSIKFACGVLGNETQNRDTGSLRKQRNQTYENKSGCVTSTQGQQWFLSL